MVYNKQDAVLSMFWATLYKVTTYTAELLTEEYKPRLVTPPALHHSPSLYYYNILSFHIINTQRIKS